MMKLLKSTMKNKIILAALVLIVILFFANNSNRKELQQSKRNIAALQDSTSYYKAANGVLVAQKLALEGTAELKKISPQIASKGLPTENVITYSSLINVSNDTIYIPVVDSVIIYKDKYYNIDGSIIDTLLTLNINKSTEIDIIFNVEYKRVLGVLWRCKALGIRNITASAVSNNPNDSIIIKSAIVGQLPNN